MNLYVDLVDWCDYSTENNAEIQLKDVLTRQWKYPWTTDHIQEDGLDVLNNMHLLALDPLVLVEPMIPDQIKLKESTLRDYVFRFINRIV